MPLFYQQNINPTTRLAIWKIEETESFFSGTVPLQYQITHPHKRLQHLAGRYLLRFLYPAFPYADILIATTNKPYLPNEQYHFSISHCGDFAAAIVSTTDRVGIDIEMPKAKLLAVAQKFLHPAELLHFEQLLDKEVDKYKQLAVLWSAKETMFKWWGKGQVDFKEMLRIESNEITHEGQLMGTCFEQPLVIQYKFFSALCMAYTHTSVR
jgi:phosphopantetheinyl transferase